jgi:hypothetical protein
VKSWDGDIQVNSELKVGTMIKVLLPLIPTENQTNILIDNDELVRLTWESTARKKGINLTSFHNFEKVNEIITTLSKDSNFYIDSQLDDGILGENIATHLNQIGFINIYITSGHDASRFIHLPFLKGIKDKSPPW